MVYGPRVQIEYIDLADTEAQSEYSELLELIKDRSLPYPLVAVNGQLRLAGSVDYHRVAPLLEEVLPQEAVV
jgi:disulfide oxidoreductase YuzD